MLGNGLAIPSRGNRFRIFSTQSATGLRFLRQRIRRKTPPKYPTTEHTTKTMKTAIEEIVVVSSAAVKDMAVDKRNTVLFLQISF
jgi:hypothetical protein